MKLVSERLDLSKHYIIIDSPVPFWLYANAFQDAGGNWKGTDVCYRMAGAWSLNTWELLPKEFMRNNPAFALTLVYDVDEPAIVEDGKKVTIRNADINLGTGLAGVNGQAVNISGITLEYGNLPVSIKGLDCERGFLPVGEYREWRTFSNFDSLRPYFRDLFSIPSTLPDGDYEQYPCVFPIDRFKATGFVFDRKASIDQSLCAKGFSSYYSFTVLQESRGSRFGLFNGHAMMNMLSSDKKTFYNIDCSYMGGSCDFSVRNGVITHIQSIYAVFACSSPIFGFSFYLSDTYDGQWWDYSTTPFQGWQFLIDETKYEALPVIPSTPANKMMLKAPKKYPVYTYPKEWYEDDATMLKVFGGVDVGSTE